ncbi:MAG: PGPGW domain-containing protein [Terriglobales bacterium]
MKTAFKRAVVLVLGWAFVLLGIVGLFLPVLQGVLFILIGLFILSSEYIWAHHVLQKVRERFPRVAGQFDRAKERSSRWLHRVFGRED